MFIIREYTKAHFLFIAHIKIYFRGTNTFLYSCEIWNEFDDTTTVIVNSFLHIILNIVGINTR